jgi:hypothetical protein
VLVNYFLLPMVTSLPALLALTPPSASDKLTARETTRLRELERLIDGFLKVGAALIEIRDGRLYRSTHVRFSDYCRDRWALSLSRCNQIMQSVELVSTLVQAHPEDAQVLTDTPESALRPLGRLEPELQVVSWELIRTIQERPTGYTIQEVVTTIREAIEAGWQTREQAQAAEPGETTTTAQSRNGTRKTPHHAPQRRDSDALGNLCRWAGRIAAMDPEVIVAGDDERVLRRHLKAARQVLTFCEALIRGIETRLAG